MPRPETLLTQNGELRKAGVWNWTLPAFVVTLSSGERFNACPNAGPCARVCYARFGTYRFSNVQTRHLQNLEYVLEEPNRWATQMTVELGHRRFRKTRDRSDLPYDPNDLWLASWIRRGGSAIRIHDAGDFFADWYLDLWLTIARDHPSILFYAYTKEVQMFLDYEDRIPENLRVIYSYGGLQDGLIEPDRHRHADVFPNLETLESQGYLDQSSSDLIAVCAPTTRIGIPANNLAVPNRRFAGRSMSDLHPNREETSV